ncbi:transglycosylase domain-containing protein [Vannielia litorea]|uniref:transglycosylase domain-containing protein n=1 Tax=Vannielia litorea TaxID=1217970 RepID=UPI001C98CA95|nr:transglycosylase domain-containing protein [Vannielia litorea]MBY6047167.1 transglycosylase domain-containing protein [Vannielia litorea]MBY6074581.1 transglycosylase domain-containing protein [Vannielia litorea]
MIRAALAALALATSQAAAQDKPLPIPAGMEPLVIAIVEPDSQGEVETFGPMLRELVIRAEQANGTGPEDGHETLSDQLRWARKTVGLRLILSDSEIAQGWAARADLGHGCIGFPAALTAYWGTTSQDASPQQIATLSTLARSPVSFTSNPEMVAATYHQLVSNAAVALPETLVDSLLENGPAAIPEGTGCRE